MASTQLQQQASTMAKHLIRHSCFSRHRGQVNCLPTKESSGEVTLALRTAFFKGYFNVSSLSPSLDMIKKFMSRLSNAQPK